MPASKMRKPKCFTSWDDVPIILDVATVALILGMPYESVRKSVQNGIIPACKVGTLWRITKKSLMEYLGAAEKEAV